ncbi:SDR family oxidoreductase [Streptomyces sp. NPDC101455]|uniref:SDR family oxidoreductase n=1 Tax=Streptomyces sp. NPDC101455 TaxID=3366142 RepID=UPI0037FC2B18
MNRLAGKRALITGGTSGIGLETAQRFIAEGADVLVIGIEDSAQQAAVLEAISSGIPLERMGMPGEVAEAVVYLASDASAFTVGQDLILDGGQTVL